MPTPGPKPKPRNQIRHRVPPVHDWQEFPEVANQDPPRLPARPRRPARLHPPEPARPLGDAGRALWDRTWVAAHQPPDGDALLVLCEQVDERQALRFRVIADGDWRERNCLRQLDAQITAGLERVSADLGESSPERWPSQTRRWWAALARLPHTVAWTDAEWQFACDTAEMVAQFHLGNMRLATEIRIRERVMGTTADARRDLRIRYVPVEDPMPYVDNPQVTAMAAYRRSVSAEE